MLGESESETMGNIQRAYCRDQEEEESRDGDNELVKDICLWTEAGEDENKHGRREKGAWLFAREKVA